MIETLEFGGAEKVVIHLANRLSQQHQVTLCLVKGRGALLEQLHADVDVIMLDLGEGTHFNLPSKLRQIVLSRGIDIMNVHNWGVFVESCAAIASGMNARVILTVHGPYTEVVPGLKSMFKRKLRHYLERVSANSWRVGRIVTVSDSIQTYITQDIGISSNKLQTIHNGIAAKLLHVSRSGRGLKLITVGRLVTIKNQKMLLEALAKVVIQHPEVTLTLVGDGPERETLQRLATRLHLNEHVEFLGFREDVVEILANHDVFLLSSDYEGISISLLEAMSQALPSIATRVGGVPETIHHAQTGLLVDRGDSAQLADAIQTLATSDGYLKTLGQNARLYFDEHFHEDIVIKKYQNLYRECVTGVANV